MRRGIPILIFVWAVLGAAGGNAQMLEVKPVPTGGEPDGVWEATRTVLQVYAAPEVLATISSLTFGGSVSGGITFETTGAYRSDYITTARFSLSLLGQLIEQEIADTTRAQGTYRVVGDSLILEQNTTPAVRDTMGFSADGDSLRLIQKIPLGEYADLVALILPAGADPPIAVLSFGKTGPSPSGLTADFDGSGGVDFTDFLLFAVAFGTHSGSAGFEPKFDLDGNGQVDFTDFLVLASQFGQRS